jgi:tRNA nucleotidyltransferase (CCA-adding enzyme)
MTTQEFAVLISSVLNGRAYIVGGYVRDQIMNRPSHDKDLMVVGVDESKFKDVFPEAVMTGNAFPVYRLVIDDEEMEIAFARKERKIASGHSGFEMVFTPDVTLKEDLIRRDTTMNAIAMDILTGEIHDPFYGVQDIGDGIVRAVSSHFIEDSVRVLRAARQAAVFGFSIDTDTISMMNSCKSELAKEPKERVFGELAKALKAKKPSEFFRFLLDSDVLDVTFPDIARLVGQTQPEQWHPEGDAFEHTMLVLDTVSGKTDNVLTRFAALMHDVGKGVTPKSELPHHNGHDQKGIPIIESLPACYPSKWKQAAVFTAQYHMAVMFMKKPGKVIAFYNALRRNPLSIDEFRHIVRADMIGELPDFLSPEVYDKVMSKVEVPKDVAKSNDGQKIAAYVMRMRIDVLKNVIANKGE